MQRSVSTFSNLSVFSFTAVGEVGTVVCIDLSLLKSSGARPFSLGWGDNSSYVYSASSTSANSMSRFELTF